MKPLSAAARPAAAVLIASALALGACTAADQTAAPAQSAAAAAEAASRVRVFQAGQKLPFAFVRVGTAKGYACNSLIPDFELARRRAIAQAQSAAVSLHANAIISVECPMVQSADKCPECWICVQCNGTAIHAIGMDEPIQAGEAGAH